MRRNTVLRLTLLALLALTLIFIGKFTAVGELFEWEWLSTSVQDAGIWGVLLFVAAFSVGILLHIPGMVFLILPLLVYGLLPGALVTYGGAMVAVLLNFLIIRFIGGKSLGEVKSPFIQKLLLKLDSQPVRVIAILRVLFWVSPPINYALALSNVRTRHFFWGTAAGLIIPVLLISAVTFFLKDSIISLLA